MPTQLDPLRIFASAFAVSSFAGLAALLRSGKSVSILSVCSAMLNTGMVGLAIALLWYTKFKGSEENIYFMIGLCVLAGLGGTTAIDFIVAMLKRNGLTIIVRADQSNDPPDPEE
jgi:predicted membrane protein